MFKETCLLFFRCKNIKKGSLFLTDFSTGIAPHCLDPGSVRSVTVEKFCGDQWEESMQVHKTIRSMSKPWEDIQQI